MLNHSYFLFKNYGPIMIRFVHAADIHLDSPLTGLSSYPGAPAERLRLATRQAFDRVIDLCLEEEVDFLVLAGDLFDTDVKDFNSALSAAAQIRRLQDIPVYLVLGNHDAREDMTRHVPWPRNVKVFDHKKPHTLMHPTLPVAFHGMSYPKREVTNNLVPDYPSPTCGVFNIGVLHTNVGGNSRHQAYAPCSVDELVEKGYDYWALGHVHESSILHQHPHVAYSGNTQGRHAREIGAKGCLLVTVEEANGAHRVAQVEFRETNVARWHYHTITLDVEHDEEELLAETRRELKEITNAAEGQLIAVRLEFTGRCKVHAHTCRDVSRQQLIANVRSVAADLGDNLWLEKITFNTQSPIDVAALRERQDLIGQLLRDVDLLAADVSPLLSLPECKDIAAKVATELSQEPDLSDSSVIEDPSRHVRWLRDAEALLLSYLVQESKS